MSSTVSTWDVQLYPMCAMPKLSIHDKMQQKAEDDINKSYSAIFGR